MSEPVRANPCSASPTPTSTRPRPTGATPAPPPRRHPLKGQGRRPQPVPRLSNRRCPRCQRVYPDPARFCPQDGSPLVEVGGAPPAPAPGPGPGPSQTSVGIRTQVREAARARSPRHDRASLLTNHVLDNRYEVGKKLGEGGMSYVYLAADNSSKETVAIKVLSPRLQEDPSSIERL